MYVQLKENSFFFSSESMELIFAAFDILYNEPVQGVCAKVYSVNKIAALRQKYAFLYECHQALKPRVRYGMLEYLNADTLENFTLDAYESQLTTLEPAAFIAGALCEDEREGIHEAVRNDNALEAFYEKHEQYFNSFLGCQSFFRQTKRLIKDFFALARELRTEAFEKAIDENQKDVLYAIEIAREELTSLPPLEYSQNLMGKTFYNRGPYERYVFSPSLFVPGRAMRFFSKDQILFFSLRLAEDGLEQYLECLRIAADSTRFRIILLLKEKGPMRGTNIAQAVSLAPSTVSHHMELLIKAGLANEEPVRNSKYYSVNMNRLCEIITYLTDSFGDSP